MARVIAHSPTVDGLSKRNHSITYRAPVPKLEVWKILLRTSFDLSSGFRLWSDRVVRVGLEMVWSLT